MSLFDGLINRNDEESRGKLVNGVVVGIVTDNHDPDGLGRVKVTFNWLSQNNTTDWVRISTPYTGEKRGVFFLPEVEDEVLVAFEHGDINRPFVIGGLWNEEGPPPDPNSDGENNLKQIKTRSGHVLLFDDTDGNEKIEIVTKSGHKIVLDDSSSSPKVTIQDKTESNLLEIDSNQNSIHIESAAKLSLKAPAIEIGADSSISIKSSGTLTIQGNLVQIN